MSEPVDVRRRALLAAGGAVAVGGVLVACQGGDGAGTSETADAQAADVAEDVADVETQESAGEALVSVDEVPVEGGVVVEEPPVVVVQPAEGDVRAFTAVCPHQGCLVSSVEANEISCPCHGSLFSAQDGSVLRGPATEGLAPVTIRIEGDAVVLG